MAGRKITDKKIIWVKICPRCNSREIEPRGMISKEAYSSDWVCMSCGFQGPTFPEIDYREAKKLPIKRIKFVPSQMPIFADKKYENPFWPRLMLGVIALYVLLEILTMFHVIK